MKKKRYLGHLKKEIREYFLSSGGTKDLLGDNGADSSQARNDKNYTHQKLNTIYFGGGTPSVLSLEEVASILGCFSYQHIGLSAYTELSFECNPEDITRAYIEGLIELGITRISLGVQSLNDTTLKTIYRSDRESIIRALDSIGSIIGSSLISLNIDMILGLPYTMSGETLEAVKELHERFPFITHTSVYMLEEGLYPKEWKAHSISEREMENEYRDISTYFESIGWHQYEISSWSQPGYECRHNQGYWDHSEYRGFGLSATSLVRLPSEKGGSRDFVRWENSHSFAGYYRGDRASEEILERKEIRLEKMIHDLRTFQLPSVGIDKEKLKILEEKGWIEQKEGNIILTPTGIFRENFILSELADVAQW